MTSNALVPYDLAYATRDDQGYNNYSVPAESSSVGYHSEVSSTHSAHSDDDYYCNQYAPTAIIVSPRNELTSYSPSSDNIINPKHPRKAQMKRQRRRRTAGGTVGGAVVGGLALGPVGAILGGVGGAALTRKICRTGEKRAVRKFEHKVMQQHAMEAAEQSTGAFA